jgi:DNA-3-methyladenine glycosylase I
MGAGCKLSDYRKTGSTICYSLMQATGMINDHLVGCFRHKDCAAKH